MDRFVRLLACTAALGLSACAGSTLGGALPESNAALLASGEKLTVTFRIVVPRRSHHRARYVSPSTRGVTIAISGAATFKETVALTAVPGKHCEMHQGATFCTESIVLAPCSSKTKNCYTAAITTYDAVSCTKAKCTIPASAHKLSANQHISFAVARGEKNEISIALDGIPVSVSLQPAAGSTLQGSVAAGFTLSKCGSDNVSVVGVDADGNYILGSGAPVPSLSSDNTASLAVATPAASTPNEFTIVRPSPPPHARTTVHLTAGVTPLAGASPAPEVTTSPIPLTFNTDVCGMLTEYPIPTSTSIPEFITVGPDGNLWFTESQGPKIGKITTNGTISEYTGSGGGKLTTADIPIGIAAGADGALWFTMCASSKIGRIDTTGAITKYGGLTTSSSPQVITSGPDKALWFSELDTGNIGRITTTGLTVNEYATSSTSSAPYGITVGPDGAMWFAEGSINKIGRMTAAPSPVETEMPVPTASSDPSGITTGSDGALWFTECLGNKIARITTAGTVTNEFPVPTASSKPQQIVLGPDGALWFTEGQGDKIGRVTTAGAFTEYPVPTASSAPLGIVSGPDGAIWFVECQGNKIGRIQ